MRKLYEEFKLYENLWEDVEEPQEGEKEKTVTSEDPYAEFNLSASEEEALAAYTEPFEIEYDGFNIEWDEDRWDPNSAYGHYSVSKSSSINDFTYEVDPEDMYDTLVSMVHKHVVKTNNIEKVLNIYKKSVGFWSEASAESSVAAYRDMLFDYQKLVKICAEDPDEGAEEKQYIFIADRLDEFFVLFYPFIQKYYKDSARNSMLDY